jgi:hypothetical protein
LAALVLLIIFFVKAFELSGRIQRVAAVPPAAPPPPAAAS